MIGIAATIPVIVAIFALIAPFPRILFTKRLTDRFTVIAIEYIIKYLVNCFVIFPERAKNVIFLFIMKFRDSAAVRDKIFEGIKDRKMKKRLKVASSSMAPDAPANKKDRNFFFSPILVK